MFYSVYDIICERIHIKNKKIDVDKMLLSKGLSRDEVRFLHENPMIPNDECLKNKLLQIMEISEIELNIRMGIIPQNYENEYYALISEFARNISKRKNKVKTKKFNPYYENNSGKLYNEDCLDVLPQMESNSVELIFADPPFNLKKDYGTDRDDDMSMSEYLNWSLRWLDECIRVLKPGGSMYIYNIPKWCIYYAEYLNKRMIFKSWIAIDMKNSFPIKNRYTPSHYGLL